MPTRTFTREQAMALTLPGTYEFLRGGSPRVWVKELDLDTTGPVYSVNWGVVHFMGLRGEWMKEIVINEHSNQPNVMATHTFNTGNTYCTDRRRNGVLATNTTMGY